MSGEPEKTCGTDEGSQVAVRPRNAEMLDLWQISLCEGLLRKRIGDVGDQTPSN